MSFLSTILLIVVFIVINGEVIERTPDNEMGISRPIVVAYYKFNSEVVSKQKTYWRNRLQIVSEDHKDLVFAVSDSDLFSDKLQGFGFEFDWKTKLKTEPIVVAEDLNITRYLLNTKLSKESLKLFVEAFKKKKLIPHIRSEPIPDNTGAAVKEVVGKTFKEMAIDNPKDVFILLYAFWCQHCKDVLPIWAKLGQRLRDEPNVDILQIDVFRNEVHKPFRTLNYPTIYWMSSKDKYSPEIYMDERVVHKFIEYIAKRATKPLIKYDRNGRLRVTNKKSDKNEL